jgi:hypothetical protein
MGRRAGEAGSGLPGARRRYIVRDATTWVVFHSGAASIRNARAEKSCANALRAHALRRLGR